MIAHHLSIARRLRPLALAAAAACAPFVAHAADAAPAPAARHPAALTVPKLPLRVRTLPNGLQVVQVFTPDAANASVQVWYRTGSKDDPAGRSGFAHLFEHLMFKSTKHLESESFDRLTEDVGGANNAFTADDTTAYHQVIPPNHVERLLWAEAERMVNLTVDEANFKSERSVVEEELRQRVLADPYGRFFNAIPKAGYLVHPYKRPGIGSIEDLEAASLEDVRAFYKTYYRPDNAVLIVTGPTPPKQLDAWVDKYFGVLKHDASPVPRVTVKEAVRTEGARVAVTGPNVPLPAIALLWQGPGRSAKDAAALRVASALLGDGDASRLHESLVVKKRLTSNVGFDADLNADAGLLIAYGIASNGKSLADIEAALQAEVERLANEPVAPAEIEKVRTRLLTAKLVERQTALGQGMAVGEAVIWRGGDPAAVNTELPELQAVTAVDVQRVMKQYVVGHPRVVVEYTQEKAPEAPNAASAPETKKEGK